MKSHDLESVSLAAMLKRLATILEIPKQERPKIITEKDLKDMLEDCQTALENFELPVNSFKI